MGVVVLCFWMLIGSGKGTFGICLATAQIIGQQRLKKEWATGREDGIYAVGVEVIISLVMSALECIHL